MRDKHSSKEYTLIKHRKDNIGKEMVSELNQNVIKKLNDTLKSIAAYYSTRASTNCYFDSNHNEICELSIMLGLGKQGSDEQKEILKKWFYSDEILQNTLSQNCFVSIPGSSNFYEYEYLKFDCRKDTIIAKYTLNHYSHGKWSVKSYTDILTIKNEQLFFLKR